MRSSNTRSNATVENGAATPTELNVDLLVIGWGKAGKTLAGPHRGDR